MFNALRDQIDPTIAAISTCLILLSVILLSAAQIVRTPALSPEVSRPSCAISSLPGRSPVRATEAMVATSHPLCDTRRPGMLRAGGNAMDAAVTAAAVQAVVEPQSTGIGGDCFVALLPERAGEVLAFNGSGRAPAAATVDWYRENGFSELPKQGPHAVTVPGAVDAWCRLLAGSRPQGHRRCARRRPSTTPRDGYVVHDRVAFDWDD